MAGDYSRRTIRPTRDSIGTFEQQGRVRVDAGYNELVELVDRRERITARDTFGVFVVPVDDAGFGISLTGGISAGRGYVDGIQVDNHGFARDGFQKTSANASLFDPVLEEQRGHGDIPFAKQPYMPASTSPWATDPRTSALFEWPTSGTWLAYLDVWHRERTWVEDSTLLDPALYGNDTVTMRQVVWQVKLQSAPAGSDCSTPDGSIPGWAATRQPSAGRLTTAAVGVPASTDPCDIPPNGGYRGVTNRLYRVEVHDPGPIGTATFCMSRDNVSLASPVTAINGLVLTVGGLGRDAVLRFAHGDLVEITDDDRELLGMPGQLATINIVDPAAGTVTLDPSTVLTEFNETDPSSVATRIRRWDQTGGAAIKITGAPQILEDGVQVTFGLDQDPAYSGGEFRTGEYWVFAARVADGSVEHLDAAPPVGPHHHFARLAVLDLDNGTDHDCRSVWPPPDVDTGGCECDVCITAEGHNSGATGATLAEAVNKVRARGGTICLGPGTYVLRSPVVLAGLRDVTVRGKGWRTVILTPPEGPAFFVNRSRRIRLENLMVRGSTAAKQPLGSATGPLGGTIALAVRDSWLTSVERCALITDPIREDLMPSLATLGWVAGLSVRDCVITGSVAIGNWLATDKIGSNDAAGPNLGAEVFAGTQWTKGLSDRQVYLAGRTACARWDIRDNLLLGGHAGIAVRGPVLWMFDNRFAGNDVAGLHLGIGVAGQAVEAALSVERNVVLCPGLGIGAAVDGASVVGNTVLGISDKVVAPLWEILRRFEAAQATEAPVSSIKERLNSFFRPGTTRPASQPKPAWSVWPGSARAGDMITAQPQAAAYDAPSGLFARVGVAWFDGVGAGIRAAQVRIEDNDVRDIDGYGILLFGVPSRSVVDRNRVGAVTAAGIVALAGRSGSNSVLTVSANVVDGVNGLVSSDAEMPAIGVGGILTDGGMGVDIRDNVVSAVSARTNVYGILASSPSSARITGNRLVQVGSDALLTRAIAVMFLTAHADVSDNDVVTEVAAGKGPFTGILVTPLSAKSTGGLTSINAPTTQRVLSFEVGGQRQLVFLGAAADLFSAVGLSSVALRGNRLEGGGEGALVQVNVEGMAQMSDNRVLSGLPANSPLVIVKAGQAIIDANHVDVPEDRVAVHVDTNEGMLTALGNIVHGRWDPALSGPWAPLNVLV